MALQARRIAYMSPQGDIYAGIPSDMGRIYRIGAFKTQCPEPGRRHDSSTDIVIGFKSPTEQLDTTSLGCSMHPGYGSASHAFLRAELKHTFRRLEHLVSPIEFYGEDRLPRSVHFSLLHPVSV